MSTWGKKKYIAIYVEKNCLYYKNDTVFLS